MPLLLLVPEALELGEAAAEGYELYRAAQAARALAQAARAARQLAQAGQIANTMLHSRTEVKGCATCPKETIPCFDTPPNGTDAEMDRQLKEQQDAINKMSPDQLLSNLAKNRDPVTGNIVRPANDAKMRSDARGKTQTDRQNELFNEYLQDRPAAQAKQDAATDAANEMKGKVMAHTPDLRAGGDGTLSPVPAGASENSSIGAQWNTGKDGQGRSRGDVLEQEAANAKARGDDKMNVELERCKNVS